MCTLVYILYLQKGTQSLETRVHMTNLTRSTKVSKISYFRILDVNDNSPVFGTAEYNGVLDEQAPVGTSVLSVQATDPDAGQNARYTHNQIC